MPATGFYGIVVLIIKKGCQCTVIKTSLVTLELWITTVYACLAPKDQPAKYIKLCCYCLLTFK